MYELIQVGEHTYYISSPAKIGVVRTGGSEVCLIDSGSDKDAGRRIRQILDKNGWTLKSIYNTHSNADHIGGNRYLQTQTGCAVYAPGIDADFTNHPLLEPSFLYGGYPPKDLRHKFLMAQESSARPLKDGDLPEGMTAIALPGHFFDMVGFRTADDVVFLADCLSSEETLTKYQISFIYDVAAYLDTLERVKTLSAALFIPSHADPAADIAPLAQKNIDKVHEIATLILEICRKPRMFEDVLKELFGALDMEMNFEQYVLVGSTVRSYLAWLRNGGRMDVLFQGGCLLWQAL